MFRRLRENGPVLLVPLAWAFATVAHLDLVTLRTVLIAHLVMDAILVAFTVASWAEMIEGVLWAWRTVLLVGLGLTLAGTVGLLATPPIESLLSLTVIGWMVVPAAGLIYTGENVTAAPRVYTAGAVLSAAGALVYAVGVLGTVGKIGVVAGLVLAAVGQTAGIVNAVVQY
jgi:hypothetical protein